MRRRELLKLGSVAMLASTFPAALQAANPARYFSAASNNNGKHFLCGWGDGRLQFQVPCPSRGHDVLINTRYHSAIFIARRPGNWLIAIDTNTGEKLVQISSEHGRHFYGHAALSHDERLLYASENNYAEGGSGVIGIYDCADSFKRLGEFSSGGIGPHQLVMLPGSQTLVIANGGILTLPDSQRDKLNIDTMQPSLTYIDTESAKILGQWQPPHHQLSLRHLDVSDDGTVAVGAQFEGPSSQTHPLLFSHKGEQRLRPFLAEDSDWRAHRHYIASVACAHGQVLATSPRGNCISLWQQGKLQQRERLHDVAGAAYDGRRQQFITSNGRGQLVGLGTDKLELAGREPQLRWDNHMSIAK